MAYFELRLVPALGFVICLVQPPIANSQEVARDPLDVATQRVAQPGKPTVGDVADLIKRTRTDLVFVKGGIFDMGDWGNEEGLPYDSNPESKPLHKVTLDSFSMLKYKVTFAEFDVFTMATGRPLASNDEMLKRSRKPKHPAAVNWYGAKAYCGWLAQISKSPFDLPTEAQWEYAARSGGQRLLYATDNGKLEIGIDNQRVREAKEAQGADSADNTKYLDVPGRNYPSYTQRKQLGGKGNSFLIPIGSFPPNPAGLFGMAEIVSEWTNDWFGRYVDRPQTNPRGPSTGLRKVTRGVNGSPEYSFVFVRFGQFPQGNLARSHAAPASLYANVDFSGLDETFRCVLNAKQPLP